MLPARIRRVAVITGLATLMLGFGAPSVQAGTVGPVAGLPPRAAAALNNNVNAILVWNNDVYVAGSFTNVGGIAAADFVARWDGSKWHALGSNGSGNGALSGVANSLVIFQDWLVVGGGFTDAAGNQFADYVARWNPVTGWSEVGGINFNGALNGSVDALAATDTTLYAGGLFTNAQGIGEADFLAQYSNNTWAAVGTGGPDGEVGAITLDGANIYVGGDMTGHIIKYDGSSWAPVGGGVNAWVNAIIVVGVQVWICGDFTNASGDDLADYVARFNGSLWNAVGAGPGNTPAFNSFVSSLVRTPTGALYAGGAFSNADGDPNADWVARFDSSDWTALGGSGGAGALNGQVSALFVNGNDVVVGGYFTKASGNTNAAKIALWHNGAWYPFGGPGRPDAKIKKGSGSYVGNNVYNNTGAGQTLSATKARGQSVTFTITVQNDKSAGDLFTIHGTGIDSSDFTIKYLHGSADITAAVKAGTYQTPAIAAGGSYVIKATVKVSTSAFANATNDWLVMATSRNAPMVNDAVKLTVKRS